LARDKIANKPPLSSQDVYKIGDLLSKAKFGRIILFKIEKYEKKEL
jgi:hypothetical protein